MHRTLERQLKNFLGDKAMIPPEWADLLRAVSDVYDAFDDDRAAHERSLELSSREFQEKNDQLKSALERYEAMVNSLPVGIYRNTPGPQGRFLEVNAAIVSMLEAESREEFMRHNVSDFYQDPEKRKQFVEKITQAGFVKNEELDLVTLKGKKFIGSVSAVMGTAPDGTVYFDGIIEDITERKRMEDLVEKSHQELEAKVVERTGELSQKIGELEDVKRAILNVMDDLHDEKERTEQAKAKNEAILLAIGDGLIVTDMEGRIVLVNRAFEALLGLMMRDVVGKQMTDVVPAEDVSGNPIPPSERIISRVLRDEIVSSAPTTSYFVRKDATRIPVHIVATRIMNNRPLGAVVVFRDITKELDLDRAKSEFISVASHQLRTPLSALLWLAESLEYSLDREHLTERQQSYLADLWSAIRRTVKLVNDLLNVSRIQLGKLQTEREPVDIVEFVKQFAVEIAEYAKLKRHSVTIDVQGKKIPMLSLDRKMISTVLQNLVSNAIDYSPPDTTVTIALDCEDSALRVSVVNQGPPIPEDEQKHLFERFYRGESAKKMKTEGTGLGLFIVKSYLEAIGGTVGFSSNKKDGTTFWFTVPCKLDEK